MFAVPNWCHGGFCRCVHGLFKPDPDCRYRLDRSERSPTISSLALTWALGVIHGPQSRFLFTSAAKRRSFRFESCAYPHKGTEFPLSVPTSTAVPAAAAEQENEKYNDEKRGGIHLDRLRTLRIAQPKILPLTTFSRSSGSRNPCAETPQATPARNDSRSGI
jgi:hypothetical protein